MATINASVGKDAENRPSDVKAIQSLLGVAADGICGPITIKAICDYQKSNGLAVDGRIDPNGPTIASLSQLFTTSLPKPSISRNLAAFLDMLSVSEGTYGHGDNGYNVLVGNTLFHRYDDHPRKIVRLSANLSSTAAGRYQLLARYFDSYKKLLSLPDFSPASQDAIAIRQIKEQGALLDIEAGRFDRAVKKVRNIWASLPGAGYGQHENSLAHLRDAYVRFGGTLAG